MSDLPLNWAFCNLGDVAQWGAGGTPSRANPAFFNGEIPWIKTGELGEKYIYKAEECISIDGIRSSAAKIFPVDSVLIAMYGATIGRASILSINASTNQACAVAIPIPRLLLSEYLFYYVHFQKRKFIEAGKGGAQPNISQSILKAWPIPLSPINEQRRIVAKIEELFSELDKGIQSLTTAREQLKAYRQSVLKHAFEGGITEGWAVKEVTPPLRAVATLLSIPLCNGRSVKDRAGGFPVLRLTALKNGAIDLTERKEGDWDRASALPFLVTTGDFLVARGSGSKRLVGVGGLVGEIVKETAFPDTMIRLRLDQSQVLPQYFSLCWNSRLLRDQIERAARTTAGIYKINQDHISAFSLPVPSLAEQAEIVRALEGKLEAVNVMEAEIEVGLTRAEALRQSILKRAFSGQLVPQDPTGEPASALLARIRAERAKGNPKKQPKPKKAKPEAA